MKFFDRFKKQNDYDFQFIDKSNLGVYAYAPPVLAKDIKPLKDYQTKKHNEYMFPRCPGMYDYATIGYIIPAWANLWIKSNNADSAAYVNYDRLNKPNFKKAEPTADLTVRPMEVDITDGLFEYKNATPNVYNFGSPWSVFAKRNMNFLVLPAYYHNPKFNDDIFGYPGQINYSPTGVGFHTINLIISVKSKAQCVFTIGEPLLHVIPFELPKKYKASYGFSESNEKGYIANNFPASIFHQFYRKYHMTKKAFSLEKRPEVLAQENKFNLKE